MAFVAIFVGSTNGHAIDYFDSKIDYWSDSKKA